MATYPITGIPVQPGVKIPQRREINDWYADKKNEKQVSLFMHAMTTFKSKPVTELLSFFQIAGIHSYPLVPWDGENGPLEPEGTNPFPGFCNHNMITFPTWHRPYMLLYEQVIHNHMLGQIDSWIKAGKLTDKAEIQEWFSAASTFRLPYWDWARQSGEPKKFRLPLACYENPVVLASPGGPLIKDKIPNPLVGFQNPTTDPKTGKRVAMGDKTFMGVNTIHDNDTGTPVLPWSKCVGTSRFGIKEGTTDWVDGINDYVQVEAALNDPLWYGNGSGSFADAVSRMFTPGYLNSWSTFSSTVHNSPTDTLNSDYMSLEYIHNIVHNTVGGINMTAPPPTSPGYKGVGLGHMSDVPVAAFDPIFWFHHCNIDRLAAIWQRLHPDLWFDKLQTGDPRPEDKLSPFHTNKERGFWTSDLAKDWTKLHYEYDDLVPKASALKSDGSVDQVKYIADLRAHLHDLYPSTRQIVQKEVPGYKLTDNTFHDYIINVIYDRYALNGRAYSILFFLGDPPENLAGYATHKNFLGSVYTFSAPVVTRNGITAGCDNCARQQAKGILSRAQIPLTLPLLGKVTAEPPTPDPTWTPLTPSDLSPERVDTILDVELQWRFVEIGGREVDASELPRTEIAVLYGTGHLQVGDSRSAMPRYGGYKRLRKATEKNGRSRRGYLSGPNSIIQDDPGV